LTNGASINVTCVVVTNLEARSTFEGVIELPAGATKMAFITVLVTKLTVRLTQGAAVVEGTGKIVCNKSIPKGTD